MGVGRQRHASAALPPGKTRYPLYKRLGGPQDRSGRVRKISPPTGIRSPDRPSRSADTVPTDLCRTSAKGRVVVQIVPVMRPWYVLWKERVKVHSVRAAN